MDRKRLLVGVVLAVVVVAALAVVLMLLNRDENDPGTSVQSPRRSTTTQPNSATSEPGSSEGGSGTTAAGNRPGAGNLQVVVKNNTIQTGLISREYLTVVPRDLEPEERLPVVVVLHGIGIDRTQMLNSADWKGAVGRDRFVAVFPQGFGNSWNLGPCCPPASILGIDDMGFLDQVLKRVEDLPSVDPDRKYITGFSAGGLMAYAVVCARPGVYQALAPAGGSNVLRCKPRQPISLLHQHSDPDPVVPYNGGPGLGQILSTAPLPSVPETVGEWAAADACDAEPSVRTGEAGEERSTWKGCRSGITVELIRIPDLGHKWPKLKNYDGLEEILRFFGLE